MTTLRQLFGWCRSTTARILCPYLSAGSMEPPSWLGDGAQSDAPALPDDLNETFYITLILAEDGEWDMSTNCQPETVAAGLSEFLFKMATGLVWDEG